MRDILNHFAGFVILAILTLLFGIIGFIIGATIWIVNVFLLQRAKDRKMMKDFLTAQLEKRINNENY